MIRRPALLLHSKLWRTFWSLSMSPWAFTPWWILLHGSLSIKAKLHRWAPVSFPSPISNICYILEKDMNHFAMGCTMKSAFWKKLSLLLGNPPSLSSDLAVWSTLVSVNAETSFKFRRTLLSLIGAAFHTIYTYHWKYYHEDKIRNDEAVFSRFES